jgi:hypothetical protein
VDTAYILSAFVTSLPREIYVTESNVFLSINDEIAKVKVKVKTTLFISKEQFPAFTFDVFSGYNSSVSSAKCVLGIE